MSERTCSHQDCDKPIKARGLCQNHYMKARRAGDPKVTAPLPAKGECDAEDCTDLRIGRQLYCNKHYQRLRRNDRLELKKTGPRPVGGTTTLNCGRCAKAFKSSPAQRRRAAEGHTVYCSRDCQKGDNLVTLPCAGCGQEVIRRKTDVRGERVFCSPACRDATPKTRTGETRTCVCGTEFYTTASLDQRYCSRECARKAQERREDRTCPNCQDTFTVPVSSERVYCTMACSGEARRAKIGDRYVNPTTGYAWIWVDAGDGTAKKVQEHRHVMSQHIGRPLNSWETVHHISDGTDPEQQFNGRSNNRIENLELWASRHPRGHRVEDLVRYCREMLGLYGDSLEQARYLEYATQAGLIPTIASE